MTNFNLKQYLTENKLLQEIKVNKPGVNFYFEQDESDDESYDYHDNQGGYYLFVGSGDEYLTMNSSLDDNVGYDDMDFAPQVNTDTLENTDEFLDYIKNIDPEFDINELKNMIDNFKKYKIKIDELNLAGDGGYVYVSVTIPYQDILPYIRK
jgi:hypothetical protein